MPSAIFLPALILGQTMWFLAPGLAAGLALRRRRTVPAAFVVPVAGLAGCLVAFGAFGAYLAGRGVGEAYSIATAVLAFAAATMIVLRRTLRRELLAADVAIPLALFYLVTLLYTSVTFACTARTGQPFCHVSGITGDNILPQIFGDNVYAGHARNLIWGWQGSDRPPLQTGATLMQGLLIRNPGWSTMGYQVIATILQVLWVPGMFLLLRSLRLPRRRLGVALLLTAGTGFFLFNSVFTWPKLLAASLVVTAYCALFCAPPSGARWAIAGFAAGAAMTAHGGAVFTLLPMAIVLLLRPSQLNWKLAVVAAAAAAAVFAPCQAYQKLYDPPGDRLLKWHLAGVEQPDAGPLGDLMAHAYSDVPAAEIAANKLENLGTLVGWGHEPAALLGKGRLAQIRDQEFRHLLFGIGLFNLGWLALLVRPLRRRAAQLIDLPRARLMLLVAAAGTVGWVVLMFGPATTIIHQGSYATMMMLFAASAAVIATFPRRLLVPVAALQLAFFGVVWVGSVWRIGHLHTAYVALTFVATAALAATVAAMRRDLDAGSDSKPSPQPIALDRDRQPVAS